MDQDEALKRKLPVVAGNRREVFDYLLTVGRGRAPLPVISSDDDPRVVALREERKKLYRAEIEHHRAERERKKEAWIRARESELAAEQQRYWAEWERLAKLGLRLAPPDQDDDDDDDDDVVASWDREELEQQYSEHEDQVARARGAGPEPEPPATPDGRRLAAIDAELQEVERKEAQLTAVARQRLARVGRQMLSVAATADVVKAALDRLAAQHKWPTTIEDRGGYLAAMAETLHDQGFAAVVVDRAVRDAAMRYDWVPSTREIVGDCRRLTGQIEQGIRRHEAGE